MNAANFILAISIGGLVALGADHYLQKPETSDWLHGPIFGLGVVGLTLLLASSAFLIVEKLITILG